MRAASPRTRPASRAVPAVVLVVAVVAALLATVSPARAQAPVRIMPLGDSNTDGYEVPGGYRIELHRALRADGHAFDFVGSLANGPQPDREHEGHIGWTIDMIAGGVDGWLNASRPNVVLLMIGTNDVKTEAGAAAAPAAMRALLARIRQHASSPRVLVSTIPPALDPAVDARARAFNAVLPGIVGGAGGGVTLVDAGGSISTTHLVDALHANAEGYRLIGAAFHRALGGILGAPPATTTTTTVPPATTTTTTAPPSGEPFTDIAGDAHAASIREVAAAGIAGGYPDGTFRPAAPVSREQMATFLAEALDLPPGSGNRFPDTAGSAHRASITAIVDAGITTGYPDGRFHPGAAVTREQMATFIAKAYRLPAGPVGGFTDVHGVHAASVGAVDVADIANGYPDGTFRPRQPVTRGQMATFLVNARR